MFGFETAAKVFNVPVTEVSKPPNAPEPTKVTVIVPALLLPAENDIDPVLVAPVPPFSREVALQVVDVPVDEVVVSTVPAEGTAVTDSEPKSRVGFPAASFKASEKVEFVAESDAVTGALIVALAKVPTEAGPAATKVMFCTNELTTSGYEPLLEASNQTWAT